MLDPHPYPMPGMAPSGVSGLTEELGVRVHCPFPGPTPHWISQFQPPSPHGAQC